MAEASTFPYSQLKDEDMCQCDVLVFPQLPKTESLLQELCGGVLSDSSLENSGDVRQSWSLNTKYYTCQLSLILTNAVPAAFSSGEIGAIILYFEPENKESWTNLRNLEMRIDETLKAEVKLLICSNLTDKSVIKKSEVLRWCFDQDFELIDLDELAEDEFDVTGIARIKQSLAAHTWPNLVMKDKPDVQSTYMEQIRKDVLKGSGDSHTATGLLDEKLVNSAMTDGGENGVESFEKLFSELSFMKDKAGQLSPTARKDYAEKVAMSFLSALGDDSGDSDCV